MTHAPSPNKGLIAKPTSIGDAANHLADLRVIWISPSYGYGGNLLYFKGLFTAFCKRFPQTGIMVDPDVRYHDAEGIPFVPKLTGWVIKRTRQVGGASYDASVHIPSPRFVAQLRSLRPDAVVAIEFTLVSLVTLVLASFSKRFAVLLLVESNPAARGGKAHGLALTVKRWACKKADAIQTSNEAGRRFLIDQLLVDSKKIRVAPYLTSSPPRPAIRSKPAQDGKLRILFANSLTARKGAHALLEALALLPSAVAKRIDLTFVGDGPERASLERQAAILSGPQIRFVGAKPYSSLGEYYQQADVLAVPSLADYRSLAGFEGLSYGLALLASIADGASTETLDSGRAGIAIDPANPVSIADAIRRLAEQPEFLSSCQANAADLFERKFSFERITDSLADSLMAARTAFLAKKKR